MTIREAHIDFDIKHQETSSAKFVKLSTYEKDWLLNRQERLYVRNLVDKIKSQTGGINDSTRRLEEINSIIKTIDLPILYDDLDRLYCNTPADFFLDISEQLYYYSCIDEYTTETLTFTKYICIFKLDETLFGSTNTNFEIELTDTITANEVIFDLSDFYSSNILQQYIIYVRHLLFEELKTNKPNYTLSLYWETFEEIKVSNSYILVADVLNPVNGVPESIRVKYQSITKTFIFDPYNYKTKEVTPVTVGLELTVQSKDCAIVSNEIAHRIQKNPYARSNSHTPKLYIEGDKIFIQPFKSTMEFEKLRLSYIRFPTFMNYQINRNSEVGIRQNTYSYMDKLVSDAVTYLSGLKSKPNFSNLLNNNTKND